MRHTFRRSRLRGSVFLVTVVLMAVLLVIALGVVARNSQAQQAELQGQKYDSSVSCAEGARQMLLGQFRAFNVSITSLQLDATIGTTRMVSGHYDQFNIQSVKSLNGNGQFNAQTAQGLSNRAINVKLGGAPYVFTVVCTDTTGQNRETEIEFLIRFGL